MLGCACHTRFLRYGFAGPFRPLRPPRRSCWPVPGQSEFGFQLSRESPPVYPRGARRDSGSARALDQMAWTRLALDHQAWTGMALGGVPTERHQPSRDGPQMRQPKPEARLTRAETSAPGSRQIKRCTRGLGEIYRYSRRPQRTHDARPVPSDHVSATTLDILSTPLPDPEST